MTKINLRFRAVVENGMLRLLDPHPELVEGQTYRVKILRVLKEGEDWNDFEEEDDDEL